MTDLRKAAEMALEALMAWEEQAPQYWDGFDMKAIEALRQALAQPEQEPTNTIETVCALLRQAHDVLSLSSLPPKREWVSLTDEEIAQAVGSPIDEVYLADFRAIEAALRSKNDPTSN